jgi:hypothetical protein
MLHAVLSHKLPRCLLAVLCLLATGTLQAAKIPPVDEAARDPSFVTFRRELIAAAQRRDRRAIYDVVANEIRFSFGDENGIRAFKKHWEAEPAGKLEQELLAVLSLGGAWQEGKRFCAPYTHARAPDDLKPDENAVILGKDVRVRARPSLTAPVVDTLSYDVVHWDFEGTGSASRDDPAWVKIKTPRGRSGYVAGRYIRNFLDYRAFFEKQRGHWRMTLFIAGD